MKPSAISEKNDNQENATFLAATWGRTEFLTALLTKSFSGVDSANNQDETSLLKALQHGHFEAAKKLLEYDVSPTTESKSGDTPFTVLAESETFTPEEKTELLTLLIQKAEKSGASQYSAGKITLQNQLNRALQTALLTRQDTAFAQQLIDKGATIIDTYSKELKGTVMTAAVRTGLKTVVTFLLAHDTQNRLLTTGNKNLETPFEIAVTASNTEMINLLKPHINLDQELRQAVTNGRTEYAKKLVNLGANPTAKENKEPSAIELSLWHDNQALFKFFLSKTDLSKSYPTESLLRYSNASPEEQKDLFFKEASFQQQLQYYYESDFEQKQNLADAMLQRIEEQKNLIDEQKSLAKEQKRLADEQQRLADAIPGYKEQKRLADEQQRLADEQQRLADAIPGHKEQKRLADEQQRKADEQQRLADAIPGHKKQQRLADEQQRKADKQQRLVDAMRARRIRLKDVFYGIQVLEGIEPEPPAGLLTSIDEYNDLKGFIVKYNGMVVDVESDAIELDDNRRILKLRLGTKIEIDLNTNAVKVYKEDEKPKESNLVENPNDAIIVTDQSPVNNMSLYSQPLARRFDLKRLTMGQRLASIAAIKGNEDASQLLFDRNVSLKAYEFSTENEPIVDPDGNTYNDDMHPFLLSIKHAPPERITKFISVYTTYFKQLLNSEEYRRTSRFPKERKVELLTGLETHANLKGFAIACGSRTWSVESDTTDPGNNNIRTIKLESETEPDITMVVDFDNKSLEFDDEAIEEEIFLDPNRPIQVVEPLTVEDHLVLYLESLKTPSVFPQQMRQASDKRQALAWVPHLRKQAQGAPLCKGGDNPLHIAARQNHTIYELLVELGMDPSNTNYQRQSASELYLAATPAEMPSALQTFDILLRRNLTSCGIEATSLFPTQQVQVQAEG